MRRLFGAFSLVFAISLTAQAHFVLVVPDANNSTAKIILSDNLLPDEKVDITKLKNTKLTLRDASGKESALEMMLEKGYYAIEVPGKGNRVIYGTTDYGVLQKGEGKPFLLKYYPKTILGGVTAETQKIGEALPVEIIPVVADGKLRFQFLVKGKAATEKDINVLKPEGEKYEKLKTDAEGFTTPFDAKGRYAVYAPFIETQTGEVNGKKYEESRQYATLVVDFNGK
jgi:hypothetical protein